MESEKLWVDKSIVLEPPAAKMKKLGVPIRKIKKDVMKKYLSDNETRTISAAGSHKCVLPYCEKVFEMKEQFLIHLAISHFWKDLTLEYGEAFVADAIHCPICKDKINPNREKTTYYRHLASAHEVVMKYAWVYILDNNCSGGTM